MKQRVLLIFIFAIIAYTLSRSPLFVILAVAFAIFISKGKVLNKEELAKAEQLQAKSIALIVGYLLRENNKTGNTQIQRAKDGLVQVFQQFQTSQIDQVDYIQNAIDYDFDITTTINRLRNSLTPNQTKFNALNVVQAITSVYTYAIDSKGDEKFSSLMLSIGLGLGLPSNIVVFLIANFIEVDGSYGYGGYEGDYNDFYRQGSNYENYHSTSRNELEEAYKILNVDENVTKDQLKRAKRIMLSQWHPDKATPEQHDAFTEMSQKINGAYDLIAQHKGFEN